MEMKEIAMNYEIALELKSNQFKAVLEKRVMSLQELNKDKSKVNTELSILNKVRT